MADRRAAGAALCCALLVLGAAPHASADERQAAKNRVTVAKRVAARVQARAELAIERHNGAQARMRSAALARDAAVVRAQKAQQALAAAQEEARLAGAAASAATSFADLRRAASRAAQEQVEFAQQQLDRFAAGSFRSAGSFGMVAQLVSARDPLELAHGRIFMNSVADVQHETVLDLGEARDAAATAAAQAGAAQDQAVHASDVAVRAVAHLDAAQDAALEAQRSAALAAQQAHRAADDAHRTRSAAEAAMARADAVVHRAVLTSARLEAAARAARRAAQSVSAGRASSAAARTAIRAALDRVGTPYSWGGGDENGPTYGFAQGAGTKGFDCSGLTLYAYAQAGIRLDHWTGSQWNQGKRISKRSELQPGDLMFFAYDKGDSSTIHHVAIYLGDHKMVEAPYTGEVVRVTSYGRDDFIGGTRPWA